MTKNDFLSSLKQELEKNKLKNIQAILQDYEEHFKHGLANNKSEEEICQRLGNPETIAKAFETENMINEVKNPDQGFKLGLAISIIGRLFVVAPFNFFILFIPGMIVFSFVVAGWAASLSVGSIGIIGLSFLPALGAISINPWAWIAGTSVAFSLLGLGVLAGLIMFIISKYILLALISYLQWNLKFIMQK
jgi:uncharacterized membrane protein